MIFCDTNNFVNLDTLISKLQEMRNQDGNCIIKINTIDFGYRNEIRVCLEKDGDQIIYTIKPSSSTTSP